MTVIELVPAYVWDCEQCGRENTQRAISVVLDPADEDDAAVIRSQVGLGPGDAIPCGTRVRMTTRPERVTCRHCGAEFRAVDCGEVPGEAE